MSAVEPVTPHSGVNVGANTRWRLVRLGVCFAEVDRRVGAGKPGVLLSVSQIKGVVRRDTITDKPPSASDFSKYKQCAAGDLVLNRFNAYRGSLGVSTEAGIVSPDYLVLRPTDANADFVEYLLRSSLVSSLMKQSMGGIGGSDPDSSGFSRIDTRQLFRFVLPLPTHDEQTQIATYLNFETAEIDAFIADQEELIGLLAERRAATISHHLQTSDNGQKMKLSWAFEFLNGDRGPNYPDRSEFVEDGIPFVNAGHLSGSGVSMSQMDFITQEKYSATGGAKLRPGDILYCLRGSVGKNAVWERGGGALASSLVALRLRSEHLMLRYGYWLLNSRLEEAQRHLSLSGTAQPNLSVESLGQMSFLVPSVAEQQAVIKIIEHEMTELDSTIADAKEAIALSRERRAALISAAVTGKIDVREHGAVA